MLSPSAPLLGVLALALLVPLRPAADPPRYRAGTVTYLLHAEWRTRITRSSTPMGQEYDGAFEFPVEITLADRGDGTLIASFTPGEIQVLEGQEPPELAGYPVQLLLGADGRPVVTQAPYAGSIGDPRALLPGLLPPLPATDPWPATPYRVPAAAAVRMQYGIVVLTGTRQCTAGPLQPLAETAVTRIRCKTDADGKSDGREDWASASAKVHDKDEDEFVVSADGVLQAASGRRRADVQVRTRGNNPYAGPRGMTDEVITQVTTTWTLRRVS